MNLFLKSRIYSLLISLLSAETSINLCKANSFFFQLVVQNKSFQQQYKIEIWLCKHSNEAKKMDEASLEGDLDVVKFLHFHLNKGCTHEAMNDAAQFGHIDIVKFLHFHRMEGCTHEAMDWAARNGNFEIVRFLHKYRTEGYTQRATNWAARFGHIEIVKFLHKNRPKDYNL